MKSQVRKKPYVRLTGKDGNVFNLAALVTRALRKAGQDSAAEEFIARLWKCSGYYDALALMAEYCEVE